MTEEAKALVAIYESMNEEEKAFMFRSFKVFAYGSEAGKAALEDLAANARGMTFAEKLKALDAAEKA